MCWFMDTPSFRLWSLCLGAIHTQQTVAIPSMGYHLPAWASRHLGLRLSTTEASHHSQNQDSRRNEHLHLKSVVPKAQGSGSAIALGGEVVPAGRAGSLAPCLVAGLAALRAAFPSLLAEHDCQSHPGLFPSASLLPCSFAPKETLLWLFS